MEFDALIDFRETGSLAKYEAQKTVFIHFNASRLEGFERRLPKIHSEIAKEARKRGYWIVGVYGDDASLLAIEDNPNHLHIAQLDRPHQAKNLVFVMPSYLSDFWYVDQKGVRNHSSIRDLNFDAAAIDFALASAFSEALYARFVEGNKSKWPQEARGQEKIEPNSALLVLQAEKMFPYEERYVSSKDLIESAIEARGHRRLYIKPHPKAPFDEQEELLKYHDPNHGVEISIASIHDLLAQADYMITQSSAVAFEANLHRTPAILTGQTDFWHNAIVAKSTEDIAEAVSEALTRKFEYERFLYWFLHEQNISTKPFEKEKLWQKLGDFGLPLAENGVQGQ